MFVQILKRPPFRFFSQFMRIKCGRTQIMEWMLAAINVDVMLSAGWLLSFFLKISQYKECVRRRKLTFQIHERFFLDSVTTYAVTEFPSLAANKIFSTWPSISMQVASMSCVVYSGGSPVFYPPRQALFSVLFSRVIIHSTLSVG